MFSYTRQKRVHFSKTRNKKEISDISNIIEIFSLYHLFIFYEQALLWLCTIYYISDLFLFVIACIWIYAWKRFLYLALMINWINELYDIWYCLRFICFCLTLLFLVVRACVCVCEIALKFTSERWNGVYNMEDWLRNIANKLKAELWYTHTQKKI